MVTLTTVALTEEPKNKENWTDPFWLSKPLVWSDEAKWRSIAYKSAL